jgi:hypothetical protein
MNFKSNILLDDINNITIGYLSWKRHDVFVQTLDSHMSKSLFNIIKPENRLIFFQNISETDINIANKYECKYFGDLDNIGILNGFIKLVEKCETEYFIFSENDWLLIEDDNIVKDSLEDCIYMLKNNITDVIKLRSSKNPGKPLYSRPKDISNWIKQNVLSFRYKLESLAWLEKPNEIYNNILEECHLNSVWYITTLNHQCWSNNIFIAKTSYLKNIILPLIRIFSNNNENDLYLGLEKILINYKSYLGKNNELDNLISLYSNTKIAGGNGLFMHKDFI